MSIKGTTSELYIGKKESNIINLVGRKRKIDYENLKCINFMYATTFESGYLDFVNNDNHIIRFEFVPKVNEKILNAIALIHENNPELTMNELHQDNLKFYERWWFITLMMFCCCAPIGLFLMWYKKKSTFPFRTAITLIVSSLWISGICVSYLNYVNTMNNLSDVYNQTYGSIIDQANAPVNDIEREAIVDENVEAFATTLTTGHYLVGTDIPVGTYNFYSKKGTGNLISSDGAVNVIFDYNKESGESIGLEGFGTEELNNIYLEDGVVLTITGNQEISAGCDDGLVDSMVKRDQEGLKEIEIGYGNYGASDNIPAGTYDIEWIEGMGNIICTSSTDNGINEIMGESSDMSELSKTNIKKFRNLTLNDGDILEIDELKVRLTPSK